METILATQNHSCSATPRAPRIPLDGDYNFPRSTEQHLYSGRRSADATRRLDSMASCINVVDASTRARSSSRLARRTEDGHYYYLLARCPDEHRVVAVERRSFERGDDAQCETPSCEQVSTFSATIDPELLQTQCPDQTTLPTSTEVFSSRYHSSRWSAWVPSAPASSRPPTT